MTEVIYIPGLSDHMTFWQPAALELWRVYGLKVHYHAVGWADGEPFEPKLNRLLGLIDTAKTRGSKVVLVGVSAGASAAINAYAKRQDAISSVVYICGKIQNPQAVHPRTYRRNPAFKQSLELLKSSLSSLTPTDKQKLLSIRSLKDGTVPTADTKISGVKEKVIPVWGHFPGIAYAITFGSHAIAGFIKKAARLG